jgi:ribose/xylose/arabinose/galactoside ABC-type transport system permease subunit
MIGAKRINGNLSSQRLTEIGLGVAIIVLGLILMFRSPYFATVDNILAILGDDALVGLKH